MEMAVEMKELIEGLLEDTHTAIPGTIESFDDANLRAEVQLLRKNESGQAPIIAEAPVMTFRAGGFVLVPPYQQGDDVLIVCAESDLEGPLYDGEPRPPERERRHSLDDAIVVGGLLTSTGSISLSGDSSSFRIGDEDGNGVLEIKDGEAVLNFDAVAIGSGSTDTLVQASAQTASNNHDHPVSGITSNGGTFSTTSGPPNTDLITDDDLTEETEAS